MKSFLAILSIYILSIIIWIWNILIPFGSKILMNIQNHANLNTPLDLMFCFKQFLIGFLYTIVLGFVTNLIVIILFSKK